MVKVESFHVGDVGAEITIAIYDGDGEAVPLSNCDVKLMIKKPDGLEYQWIVEEKSGNKITYKTRIGDLDQSGIYKGYPKVTWIDGSGKSFSGSGFTFPVLDVYEDTL